MKEILQDLSLPEVEALVAGMGEPKFRAGQLYRGLMRGARISDISELSKAFKAKLLERFEDEPVRIAQVLTASDGTEKYLFALADGNIVEGVLMRYKYGNTLCVSSQVGCRMGCKFCASTLGGLVRNLSAGEILGEVLSVNALGGGNSRYVTNIVMMGSGEPLDNFDNVTKFLHLVSHPDGINISERNISLSTCGIVPAIRKLADMDFSVNLTLSLHNPFDEQRRQIMPIANAYDVSQTIDACRYYFEKTGRRVIVEYTLIDGQNDSYSHAVKLASLLREMSVLVNVIALNPVRETGLKGTSESNLKKFLSYLEKLGISATRRRTMGQDIEGACGQLRRRYLAEETTNEN